MDVERVTSSPLVDGDWHTVCQAIYTGIEEEEWEKLCYKSVGIGKAVNIRQPSTSRKASTKDERRRVLRSR